MVVAVEQRRTVRADGPIAERRAFRRAADDADVLGHGGNCHMARPWFVYLSDGARGSFRRAP